MASPATTWRSPLSILMGARRNDDDDLELRENLFPPRSPDPAAAPPPPKSPSPAGQSQAAAGGGIASYLPFRYFGLSSASPGAAEIRGDAGNDRASVQQSGSPVPPPRGAFPPPLSEGSPEGNNEGGRDAPGGDDAFPEERDDHRGDEPGDAASDPSLNPALSDSNHGGNYLSQPDGQAEFFEARPASKKSDITSEYRKSIHGATFNFTNSIIGAGGMGLGGAFAASGGGVSMLMLLGFALLTKKSLDLVVDLNSNPSVIQKARSRIPEHGGYHGENDGSDEMSSSEEIIFSKESKRSERSTQTIDPPPEKSDEIEDSKNAGTRVFNEADIPLEYEREEDVTPREDQSSQKVENNESSPLMAHDKGQDGNGKLGVALEIPSAGLSSVDHPLLPAHTPLDENDRYSLDLGATSSKHPSPLYYLNLNDRVVRSPPSVENVNVVKRQRDAKSTCTHEELGWTAFGQPGRLAVLVSKALYSFGCLVAYVVVVRDNFGMALRRIMVRPASPEYLTAGDRGHGWLYDDDLLAFWISGVFMLPLSCPRTMKLLANFSFISILSMLVLVLVVTYLFFTCSNPVALGGASFCENWIQIRSFSGLIESLGCFVFSFVCHHTVNLAYESLPLPVRNPKIWRRVSTNSIALALEVSLAIGVFAYLTFGSQTPADVLMGYPADLTLANIARLLLCLTMVLTFPLPFLTCREMIVLICLDAHRFYHASGLGRWRAARFSSVWACACGRKRYRQDAPAPAGADFDDVAAEEADFVEMQVPFFGRLNWRRRRRRNSDVGFSEHDGEWWDGINGNDPTQALLLGGEHETAFVTSIGGQKGKEISPSPLSSRSGDPTSSESTVSSVIVPPPGWIMGDRQLTLVWHATLTFALWLIVTVCAIKSPSLGDVLDVVGACTGTMLAFVLPCLFSFKLIGYSHLSLGLLIVGGLVGLIGSLFSFVKIMRDAQ